MLALFRLFSLLILFVLFWLLGFLILFALFWLLGFLLLLDVEEVAQAIEVFLHDESNALRVE